MRLFLTKNDLIISLIKNTNNNKHTNPTRMNNLDNLILISFDMRTIPGISLSLLEACSFQGNNPVLAIDFAHILSVASHSLLTAEYLVILDV